MINYQIGKWAPFSTIYFFHVFKHYLIKASGFGSGIGIGSGSVSGSGSGFGIGIGNGSGSS